MPSNPISDQLGISSEPGFALLPKICSYDGSSILQTPIFRQAVPYTDGVQTSSSKALRHHTYLYYLQRLGLTTGFMQILGPYDTRRGAGNKVDGMSLIPFLQETNLNE